MKYLLFEGLNSPTYIIILKLKIRSHLNPILTDNIDRCHRPLIELIDTGIEMSPFDYRIVLKNVVYLSRTFLRTIGFIVVLEIWKVFEYYCYWYSLWMDWILTLTPFSGDYCIVHWFEGICLTLAIPYGSWLIAIHFIVIPTTGNVDT